jgi:hypothetical protein
MKKLLISASLLLGLTLLTTISTLAAVHNFTGDFFNPFLESHYNGPSFDDWYYIEKDAPSATVRASFPKDCNYLGMEYFINDQTFVNFSYADPDDFDSIALLNGSYLFDNHFFVGLDTASVDDDTQITVTPGYRFDLDENCYVAVSMDYALNHDDLYQDSGLVDFEVNGRYYTQDSRIFGALIIPNDDVTPTDDTYFNIGGAYKYADNIVVGANLWSLGDIDYFEVGCTTAFDKLGAELRYISDDTAINKEKIDCNVLYSFADNIRAGLETYKENHVDDLYWVAKAKYTIDQKNAAILFYQFKNSADNSSVTDGTISLRWDIAF